MSIEYDMDISTESVEIIYDIDMIHLLEEDTYFTRIEMRDILNDVNLDRSIHFQEEKQENLCFHQQHI